MNEQVIPVRRYVVVLDVVAADLDEMDATYDDVKEGLMARLEEFYPVGGYPARGYVSTVAEVTESYDLVTSALHVGLEGLTDGEWVGYTRAQTDEANVALERLRDEGA